MSAVAMQGVRVEAGGRAILDEIGFDLPSGAFALVTGPSGCGKTTLLRVVAGLARPVRGEVLVDGRVVGSGPRLLVPPEDRGVGMLFQGGGLWPHMTVRGTLAFVLARGRTPRNARARRIQELVDGVELTGLEDRRPGELSGGEAQRLALARALAQEPRILLLDEPLGSLDTPLRGRMLELLAGLHERLGLTMLYVTHDPEEATELATHRLRLERGRLVSQETCT